ncbi:CHASE2 domain-containing protein [Pseudomonas yamanorum]
MVRSAQMLFRRGFWEWIIIAMILLSSVGLLAYKPDLPADRLIYDTLVPLTSSALDSSILLVTIDDDSISALGRWPWPRDIHTQLLNKLALLSPKSVLYDVIFTEPDLDPRIDARLGEAMARIGTVVVPTLREAKTQPDELPHFLSPIGPVAKGAKAVGHIYIAADVDGVVRRVYLKEGNAHQQLTQLTWRAYAATFPVGEQPLMPPACCATDLGGHWFGWNEVLIPFSRASVLTNSVSVIDVLNGNIPSDALHNKIILVGATASGLGDRYPTPVASSEGAMAGVITHAYLLNGLLTNHLIKRVPAWVSVGVSIISVLIVLGLLLTSRLHRTFLVCLSFIFASTTLSVVLLMLGRWWSPAPSIIGVVLTYLIWNWRRLQAIVTYFGLEIDRISLELNSQPMLPATAYHGDKLIHRTMTLEAMINHVRSSRRFIAQSLDSLPEAIFVTDLAGQILLANLSALTLQTEETHDLSRLDRKDIFQILRNIEALDMTKQMASEKPWHNHACNMQLLTGQLIFTPSGRSFKIQVSPMDTEKNEPTGWLVGLLEFTVERLAEEQRNSMLRFLSHDLRAPQSAILALLTMQEKSTTPLPANELRRQIEHQVKRTLGLTDSFMLLDAVKSKPQMFEELIMGAIVLDAVDQVWPLAQSKKIRLKHNFVDDESCVVFGSRELLTRAIFNLLENAVKYSNPSTTIHIQLSRLESEALLKLQDEGQGISEEDLPQLYDEFRQFGKGTNKGDGYGLGMAFVSKVIQRHGARIECTSRLNVGTTFELYFRAI